jgi:hypothetical protein
MKNLFVFFVALTLALSIASQASAIDQTLIAEQGNFRLIRLEYSNQDMLEYSVTPIVTEKVLWDFLSPGYDKANQPPLAKKLFSVKGVRMIQFTPYHIKIFIATPAYDREEMKAKVERAILARYRIKVKSIPKAKRGVSSNQFQYQGPLQSMTPEKKVINILENLPPQNAPDHLKWYGQY